MLVGSCVPTTEPFDVWRVICVKPGCPYKASAMTERAALAALRDHWTWIRDNGEPHGVE